MIVRSTDKIEAPRATSTFNKILYIIKPSTQLIIFTFSSAFDFSFFKKKSPIWTAIIGAKTEPIR